MPKADPDLLVNGNLVLNRRQRIAVVDGTVMVHIRHIREKIKENCGEKEIIMGISVIVMVCSAVLIHLLKASYTTGTVFLLLAFCLFLVRDPDAGAVSLQNYAPNYLLFATVFLQYRVCRRVQDRWLKERVRRYVEQVRENSRTEKEEALGGTVFVCF